MMFEQDRLEQFEVHPVTKVTFNHDLIHLPLFGELGELDEHGVLIATSKATYVHDVDEAIQIIQDCISGFVTHLFWIRKSSPCGAYGGL